MVSCGVWLFFQRSVGVPPVRVYILFCWGPIGPGRPVGLHLPSVSLQPITSGGVPSCFCAVRLLLVSASAKALKLVSSLLGFVAKPTQVYLGVVLCTLKHYHFYFISHVFPPGFPLLSLGGLYALPVHPSGWFFFQLLFQVVAERH